MIQVKNSTQYYINERALTFSENDLDDPSRVAVSLVSGTVILVHVPGTIDYASDGNYERWTLRGYSTLLVNPEAHYIYARLSRTDRTALIVFSVKNYNIDGSITTVNEADGTSTTTDPSADYFYVKIGELTATDSVTNPTIDRELTYDSGLLSTAKGDSMTEASNMWELLPGTNPLIKALHWLTDFTVKGYVKLIGGLKFSKGQEGDEKPVTDLKRSTDSDESVPVSDETIPTTQYVQDKLEGFDERFLSKVKPDETEHRVKFKDGIEAGEFVTGMVGGTGAQIDGDGRGEMHSLVLREFLEVPELRFNRVDVVSGELWNSIAFGLVESVDTVKRICTLKLEDGERSGLKPNDICRGIFSDFGTGTVTDEEEDQNGFKKMFGFSTCYFTPTEILVNEEGSFQFRYNLQEGTSVHPCPSMKFAVYGNFIDTARQASAYSTRTYKRYLNKVNTWKLDLDKNLYAQYGDIEGLTIGGYTMHGYGSFQHNVYLTGSTYQFTPQQKEELKGEDAYSVTLSDYEGIVVIDDEGNVIGGESMLMNVITTQEADEDRGETIVDGGTFSVTATQKSYTTDRGTKIAAGTYNVTTSAYRLTTQVQAMRGSTVLHHALAPEKDAYVIGLDAVGCTAMVLNGVVVVTSILEPKNCKVNITVNCEGKTPFQKTYRITTVTDGKNPIVADLDNEMDAVACDPEGKVLFGLPVKTTVGVWAGTKQLVLDEVTVTPPQGVTVEQYFVDQNGKKLSELTEEETAAVEYTSCVISIPAKTTVDGEEIDGITQEAERTLPIVITAYAYYGGIRYHRTLTFTVNKIIAGENAVIYKLLPSVTSVKVYKDNKLSTDAVSCSVVGFDGKKSVPVAELGDNFSSEFLVKPLKVDGDTTPEPEYAAYEIGTPISITKDDDQVAFRLYQKSGEEVTLIDTETVPIIRDGVESKNVTAYIRTNNKPAAPEGGTFDDPKPETEGWSLSAPEGKQILWGSFRTFTSNGLPPQDELWSDPVQMTDTASMKIIWSSLESPKSLADDIPPAYNSDWTDDPDANAIWMAITTQTNGEWSKWQVSKVKGKDALSLIASTLTISRNSFGTYQPATIRVRSMREGVEEAVYISAWGIYDDPDTNEEKDHFIGDFGKVSYVDFVPATKRDYDFKRVVFRAFEQSVSSYNDTSYITETIINYIGDGASGPMARNRGRFSTSANYFYNDNYRDFVWTDDGKVFMREGKGIAYSENGTKYDDNTKQNMEGGISGVDTSETTYWVEVPKHVMMAIDTALIDNANIAGFTFTRNYVDDDGHTYGVLRSENGTLELDAYNGKLTCKEADIEGSLTAGTMSLRVKEGGGSLDGYTMAFGPGEFFLPSIEANEHMEIKAFWPMWSTDDDNTPLLMTSKYVSAPIRVYEEGGGTTTVQSYELKPNVMYTFHGVGAELSGGGISSSAVWVVGESIGGTGTAMADADDTLNATSTNPIQNQAVYHALAAKIQKVGINDPMDESGVLYVITE